MKKLLLIVAAALFAGTATADDSPIPYSKVPKAGQTFIAQNFPKHQVVSAMKDFEITGSEYTVYLESGIKVEFRSNGTWKEVDCGPMGVVPAAIVPARISAYVAQNFPDMKITKIDVDRTDYELKISNGLELKFDLQGNFLHMDD